MNAVRHILAKSLTAYYYRQNAGLFLFLFFLLFGTQPSFHDLVELHHSILQSILTSGIFFIVTLAIWLLYSIKVISFIYGCCKNGSYDFLFELNCINKTNRFFYLLRPVISLLTPVWLYGSFIIIVGIKEQHWQGAINTAFAVIFLILGITFIICHLLQKAKGLQQISSKKNILSISLPASLFKFLIVFLFQRQFLALLITKFLSFFIIYFFTRTEAHVFEDRMLWLIFITALIGHSFIIYRLLNFMEKELSFYRNMPVKKTTILLSLFFIYVILLLPEAWALLGVAVNQHNWNDYWWMVATGPFFLLLLHSLLYTEDLKMEEFLKLLFGIWIVFILFSLSNNHWMIPVICAGFAVIIFFNSYRSYEKKTAVESIE
ncbi:MAG: hypothetical protein ABIP79_06570 [Chitinophagaceae bacterium]